MTLDFALALTAGAAAGGFINGLAGFGTALFALGFWLQIMPPLQAVAIVVVLSVVSGIQGVVLVRRSIMDHPGRLWRFLLPALIGVPAGVAALSILDPAVIKLVIAGFLIVYGGFFSLRKNLPKISNPTPTIDRLVGLMGGFLGGAASLSGALPTMWCSMRPWPKAETRAVLQPFNVIVLGMTALIFAVRGVYDTATLTLVAIALPIAMLFAQLGIQLYKRLSDDQFRRLIIGMMFVSGVVLLFRELS